MHSDRKIGKDKIIVDELRAVAPVAPAAAAATASPAGANANTAAKGAKRPNPLLGVVHTSKPRVAAPDGYEWDCIDANAGSWVARRRT